MDYYDKNLYCSLMDFKQFTTKEMSIKNNLIKHLQDANKSLNDLVNFQQEVISAIITIYRKHIVKLLALTKFNIDDKHNFKYKRTIMRQAATINEMFQVMQKAVSLDSQEPLIYFQEFARLQKENKDLRELLNIANQYGSFSMSGDAETQTIDESITEGLVENIKNNDISEEDMWAVESNSIIQRSTVLEENNEIITKQLNDEPVSIKSGETVEPAAQEITKQEDAAQVVLSALRLKDLRVKTT